MKLKYIGIAAVAVVALAGCSSTASSTTSESPTASASVSPTATGDVVAVAAGNPTTTTLVTAVEAAGLVETLQGPGPFTVFAPTDEAFAALPAGVLDKLVQPENKATLQKILTYHVVSGAVYSSDIKAGKVKTVEGQDVTLSTTDGVTINGAAVSTADVPATNGVVHLIDQVLVPPGVDVSKLK